VVFINWDTVFIAPRQKPPVVLKLFVLIMAWFAETLPSILIPKKVIIAFMGRYMVHNGCHGMLAMLQTYFAEDVFRASQKQP